MFSLIKFFFACSIPFLMAMGTSRALPMPNPAWPWLSPTTTSAEKLRFLPPFTSLVTRLMAITSSFSSEGFTSKSRRTASLSRKICFDIGLELYPRFPRRIRERFDAAVILVSAAVEHDFTHPGGLGALGDRFADHFWQRRGGKSDRQNDRPARCIRRGRTRLYSPRRPWRAGRSFCRSLLPPRRCLRPSSSFSIRRQSNWRKPTSCLNGRQSPARKCVPANGTHTAAGVPPCPQPW